MTRYWKKVAKFFQTLPKDNRIGFYVKFNVFKIAQKPPNRFGTFVRKSNTFKICLNWSHWKHEKRQKEIILEL